MRDEQVNIHKCISDQHLIGLCKLAKYYREEFVPAYADAVIYLNAKPDATLLEMENVLSHVTQMLDLELDAAKKEENIQKAKGHLERATLDCLKIIWGDIGEQLQHICGDEELRKKCVKIPDSIFTKKVYEYQSLLCEARRVEMKSIGKTHEETIIAYKRAIELAKEIMKAIDCEKIENN